MTEGRVVPGAQMKTLLRFSPSARALHWTLALSTLGLLASGLPLWFPTLRLHLALAVFLLAPLVVFLLGDRRGLRAEGALLLRMTPDDWRWLRVLPAFLLGLPYKAGPIGRYNGGQKLNAWGLVLCLTGLTVTGVLLWVEAPAPLLPALRQLHDALTAALGVLVAGHILLASLHPRTRAALRGMLDGRVPAEWAARQYPGWSAEMRQHPVPDRPGAGSIDEARGRQKEGEASSGRATAGARNSGDSGNRRGGQPAKPAARWRARSL